MEKLPLLPLKKTSIRRSLLASFFASIMSFASGTVIAGWTAPENPLTIGESLFMTMNLEQISWIVSIYLIGALVGALPASKLAQTIGPKRLLLLLAVPMTLGWLIIMSFVNDADMIYVGRFLCGLSLGAVTVAVPFYNHDIAPDVCRGRGGVFFDFMLCAGILYSYASSAVLGLQMFSFSCSLIPVVFCAFFWFMPESPQYLYRKGRMTEAKSVLKWLRGENFDVTSEFDKFEKQQIENSRSSTECLRENDNLKNKNVFRKAILLSLALVTIQRMSGAAAIIQFTAKLFKMSGSSVEPITASIITGIFQLVGSGVTIALIDKIGRRQLLLISSSVVVTCLSMLTLYFYCLNKNILANSFKVLPIIIVCTFISFFRLGLGPIPWFMTNELLRINYTNRIQSYVISYSWTLSFIILKTFMPLVNEWPVALWFGYSVLSAIGLICILLFMPETNNKTCNEIQLALTKKYQIKLR